MKLVRRAATNESSTGRKNHNTIHWYYIDSFKGDAKLKQIEDALAENIIQKAQALHLQGFCN